MASSKLDRTAGVEYIARFMPSRCPYEKELWAAFKENCPKRTRAVLERGTSMCTEESPTVVKVKTGGARARVILQRVVTSSRRLLWQLLGRCPLGYDHQSIEWSVLTAALENGRFETVPLFLELRWQDSYVKLTARDKRTLLHLAVAAGDVTAAAKLLERGASVRARTCSFRVQLCFSSRRIEIYTPGSEPIHCALSSKSLDDGTRLDCIRLLLRYGADPNCHDDDGHLALNSAASNCERRVLEFLLDNGGDLHACDRRGRNLLFFARDAETISLLLNRGVDPHVKDNWWHVALHSALVMGHISAAEILSEFYEENIRDKEGITPLHLAAGLGHGSVAHVLIARLVEKKRRVDTVDCDGCTPLHFSGMRRIYHPRFDSQSTKNVKRKKLDQLYYKCMGNDHAAIAEALLRTGSDPNRRDCTGRAPLHWAAERGEDKIVKQLLKHGAQVDQKDSKGLTALNLATALYAERKSDIPKIVQLLLEQGADPNRPDTSGSYPLHNAVQSRNDAVMQLLLEHNADIDMVDAQGCTALHHAVGHNYSCVVKVLLVRGASVNAKDKRGRTALHVAAQLDAWYDVQQLLEFGADPLALDNEQQGPVNYFFMSNWTYYGSDGAVTLRLLLEAGANPNLLDSFQKSPLHHAASSRNYEILQLLHLHNADVHRQDSIGRTALHDVMISGYKHQEELLLKNNASIKQQDVHGRTVLHYATQFEPEFLEQIILQYNADLGLKDENGRMPLEKESKMHLLQSCK